MQWIYALTITFILLEYSYARYKGVQIYSKKECILTAMTFVANYLIVLYADQLGPHVPLSSQQVYHFFDTHFRFSYLNDLTWSGPTWLRWIVLFLAMDLLYYATHRLAHKISFFWAGHFTHHTITSLNIINAHRDPIKLMKIGPILVFMPLIAQFSAGARLDGFIVFFWISVYSTWMHCTFIPRVPLLEWVFNTPSSHRMHHSLTNEDRTMAVNFGGILIIWDRMFGTYLPEEKTKHVYGVTGFYQSDRLWPVLFYQWVQYFKAVLKPLLNLRLARRHARLAPK